jgi:hypothetical protein
MLEVIIPARPDTEYWDSGSETFITKHGNKEQKLCLEHSLVSVRKWESKWHKPFLSKKQMTNEEIVDYIRCMTITQNVPPEVYENIPDEVYKKITEYINDPMTATWFSEQKGRGGSGEVVTAELIYYWMIALNIPSKYEKWHLNSLMTLIKVCNIKNAPAKKMGKRATASKYAALNAARRQQFNSNG